MTRFRTTILLLIKIELLLLSYLAFLSYKTRHTETFVQLEQYRNSSSRIDYFYEKSNNEVLKSLARKKTTKSSKIVFLKTLELYDSVQIDNLKTIPFPLISILYRNQISGLLYKEYEQIQRLKYLPANYKTVVELIKIHHDSVEIKLFPMEYIQIRPGMNIEVDDLPIAKMPIKILPHQEYEMAIKNPVTGEIQRYIGL
ncbi:hypothetical protein N9B82_04995 [Saprospiraceae bacterium]|nr:hypothetical protein [Saprospiraceae bacterium]